MRISSLVKLLTICFLLFGGLFFVNPNLSLAQTINEQCLQECTQDACKARTTGPGCSEEGCTTRENGERTGCHYTDTNGWGGYCRPDPQFCVAPNSYSADQCQTCRAIQTSNASRDDKFNQCGSNIQCFWDENLITDDQCYAHTPATVCGNFCFTRRTGTFVGETDPNVTEQQQEDALRQVLESLGLSPDLEYLPSDTPGPQYCLSSQEECRNIRDLYITAEGGMVEAVLEGACGDSIIIDGETNGETSHYLVNFTTQGTPGDMCFPFSTGDEDERTEALNDCEALCQQKENDPASSCDSECELHPGGCGNPLDQQIVNQSYFGQGVNSVFTLNGFKPFENVEGLYDGDEGGANSLPHFINTFLGFIIGISGAAVVVMIVVGGFRYVMSSISTVKTKAAADIRNSLIGLGLLLVSVALLNTLNPQLLNLEALRDIEVTISTPEFVGHTGFAGPNYGGGSASLPFCFNTEDGGLECRGDNQACQNHLDFCSQPGSDCTPTSACLVASPQQLASLILEQNSVHFQEGGGTHARNQITAYKNGDFSCNISPTILGFIYGMSKSHTLYISSLNRSCYDGCTVGAGEGSRHCRSRGGHAVDFGKIDSLDGPGNNQASGQVYQNASRYLPAGSEYGQVLECDVPFSIPGGSKGTAGEPCNHFHFGAPVN